MKLNRVSNMMNCHKQLLLVNYICYIVANWMEFECFLIKLYANIVLHFYQLFLLLLQEFPLVTRSTIKKFVIGGILKIMTYRHDNRSFPYSTEHRKNVAQALKSCTTRYDFYGPRYRPYIFIMGVCACVWTVCIIFDQPWDFACTC